MIGGASNPAHDTVVVCRVAMTDRILAELMSTLQQAAVVAQPPAEMRENGTPAFN